MDGVEDVLRQLEKWKGSVVEIVYMDRKGSFTQRKIRIMSVRGSLVKAYCFTHKAIRLFRSERILAIVPLHHQTG
jgi:predicted DNA-binding transcriptional regulator YafY